MKSRALALAPPVRKVRLSEPNGIQGLIERFLASQDIKSASRETYRRGLKPFFSWIQARAIKNPTRSDILAYKKYLEGEKISPLTLSSYLVVVRRFFEWAESEHLYPNIAKGVKGAKRAKGFRKDPLTVSQIKSLLKRVDVSTVQGLRDFAILNLLIRTGLRTVEVIRADVGDISQQAGEAVLWIHGKGRDAKDEFVVLTDETLQPIRTYLTARGKVGENEPLFSSISPRNRDGRLTTRSISRTVKENLMAVGLDSGRLTAHSLRHTAITLSLQAGASVQEAQALGRHADINTTLIYAHNISRVAHAPEKKIAELLSGVNSVNRVNKKLPKSD